MPKRRPPQKLQSLAEDVESGLVVAAPRLRNRVAINPLLKKSGAHQDKRALAKLKAAQTELKRGHGNKD